MVRRRCRSRGGDGEEVGEDVEGECLIPKMLPAEVIVRRVGQKVKGQIQKAPTVAVEEGGVHPSNYDRAGCDQVTKLGEGGRV